MNALCTALASPLSSPGLKNRLVTHHILDVTIAYPTLAVRLVAVGEEDPRYADRLVAAVRGFFNAREQLQLTTKTSNFDHWLRLASRGVSAAASMVATAAGANTEPYTKTGICSPRTYVEWCHTLNKVKLLQPGRGSFQDGVLWVEPEYTQIYQKNKWKFYDDVCCTRDRRNDGYEDWEAALSLADKALAHSAERDYGRAVVGFRTSIAKLVGDKARFFGAVGLGYTPWTAVYPQRESACVSTHPCALHVISWFDDMTCFLSRATVYRYGAGIKLHVLLGRALVGAGNFLEAIDAFGTSCDKGAASVQAQADALLGRVGAAFFFLLFAPALLRYKLRLKSKL